MLAANCAPDSSDSPGPMSGLPHADWTLAVGTTNVSIGVERSLPANSRRVASPHVALPDPVAVARTSTLHAIRGALSGPTLRFGPSMERRLTVTSIGVPGPVVSPHPTRRNERPTIAATPRRELVTTMGVLRDRRNSRALALAIKDRSVGVARTQRLNTSHRRRFLRRRRLRRHRRRVGHHLAERVAIALPRVEDCPPARAPRGPDMLAYQTEDELLVGLVKRTHRHHVPVATGREGLRLVEHVGHAVGHAGGEVASHRSEYDHHAACHVLAT